MTGKVESLAGSYWPFKEDSLAGIYLPGKEDSHVPGKEESLLEGSYLRNKEGSSLSTGKPARSKDKQPSEPSIINRLGLNHQWSKKARPSTLSQSSATHSQPLRSLNLDHLINAPQRSSSPL
ncbi:hypothetical protein PCANC_05874 [Puccinia coronata f. sp. avenae]|uniref:Uncharacterized protein n=1 Tax=Puccinia coronata f. sp. avenae TaxID=200324 RepID=A0A2N5VBN8_9BASI|nr:hypothetical protein PCANC_05874 [Puccinia coronata f. sp. avenae]